MVSGRKLAYLEMHDGKTNQKRIWDKIRARPARITFHSISKLAGVHYKTVKRYMISLESAGYITRIGTHLGEPEFKFSRDNGFDAPRVRPGGGEGYEETGKDVMWRTIRILGRFSAYDLVVQSSLATPIKLSTAQRFLKRLYSAGYLDLLIKSKSRELARYRLKSSMNTGPSSPVVQRDGNLFDPNLNKVIAAVKSAVVST